MNNNPKVNFTEECIKQNIQELFIHLLIERDHPEIIEEAAQLVEKFLQKHQEE